MSQTVSAIFEHGVFRPTTPSDIHIPEGQEVRLIVESIDASGNPLDLAMRVFDGLSDQQVNEIEKIILNRSDFFGGRTAS